MQQDQGALCWSPPSSLTALLIPAGKTVSCPQHTPPKVWAYSSASSSMRWSTTFQLEVILSSSQLLWHGPPSPGSSFPTWAGVICGYDLSPELKLHDGRTAPESPLCPSVPLHPSPWLLAGVPQVLTGWWKGGDGDMPSLCFVLSQPEAGECVFQVLGSEARLGGLEVWVLGLVLSIMMPWPLEWGQ